MPLIKKLSIAIFLIVAVLYAVSSFFPSQWSVKRSIVIDAPADQIFPYINDLHKWSEWYPWTRRTDVSMVIAYDGPGSGEGAIRRWSGSSTKSGEIKIIRSVPGEGVWYTFRSENSRMIVNGSIKIREESHGENRKSEVTWQDTGDSGYNFFMRFLSGGLDQVIGSEFENGLAALKKAVENSRQ